MMNTKGKKMFVCKAALHLSYMFLFSGCGIGPEFLKTVDDVATDDAIEIKIDRDAFKKETDVLIDIRIINKEPKP